MRIIGVYPVTAPQQCHLVELELDENDEPVEWNAITQELPGPRANWQAPYDETPLNNQGTKWAFFFHYLDFSKPLLTAAGVLKLPEPTPMPDRLKHVEYVEP
jgi:hypothetical protein